MLRLPCVVIVAHSDKRLADLRSLLGLLRLTAQPVQQTRVPRARRAALLTIPQHTQRDSAESTCVLMNQLLQTSMWLDASTVVDYDDLFRLKLLCGHGREATLEQESP